MRWIRYIAVTLVNTFGAVIGILWIPVPQAMAQSSTNWRLNSSLETPLFQTSPQTLRSLPELYQHRERLKTELKKLSNSPNANLFKEDWRYELLLTQSENLTTQLQAVEAQIIIEEKANQTWKQASNLATQAVASGRVAGRSSLGWQKSQDLWQTAIDTLRQLPQDSYLSGKALEKIIQYQGYLAIATYEGQMARSVEAENTQAPQETGEKPAPQISAPPPQGFTFVADTNRDGVINQKDVPGREIWSLSKGALMLFNNDDDDRDGSPDWQDRRVNGERDQQDLTPIQLQLSPKFTGTQIFLTVDPESRRYVNIFQKTIDGWQPVDLSGAQPLVFDKTITLGVEAKQFADRNWSGLLNLKASANNGVSDTIQLGVTPWMMSPNTAPVQDIHVSDRRPLNTEFVEQVQEVATANGAQAKVTEGAPARMQDVVEIGYVQFPSSAGLRKLNVALNANQNRETENYGKSLLTRDFGLFEAGSVRPLDPLNQWADFYGNLEVTPPLAGYPRGRVYYGNAGTVAFNPDIIDFIKAQKIQGPPVDIDTSWLLIRHVDEVISFIPNNTGKPVVMIVSPEAGVKLLEDLERQGYGDLAINRDLSTQTTVREALSNQALMQHNLNLQREKLNGILQKVKAEFKLSEEQIIQVPALFGYSGYSWWPNMVNSVAVNGELLVSNPRGPLIDGVDYTQAEFRRLVEPLGVRVKFLDDRYYQELKGNTHQALNTTRPGEEQPFWNALPENLKE